MVKRFARRKLAKGRKTTKPSPAFEHLQLLLQDYAHEVFRAPPLSAWLSGWRYRLNLIQRERHGVLVPRYSAERRAAVLKKLLPPLNRSVVSVATEEGIPDATLYSWLKQCREKGVPAPGYTQSDNEWLADARLAVVIETATLSEATPGAYCREKGL